MTRVWIGCAECCLSRVAERKGFRHFLEIFDPNRPMRSSALVPAFINDVTSDLSGVTSSGRPLFLKMVYHGPPWKRLVHYDPHLVVGIWAVRRDDLRRSSS